MRQEEAEPLEAERVGATGPWTPPAHHRVTSNPKPLPSHSEWEGDWPPVSQTVTVQSPGLLCGSLPPAPPG